MGSSSSGNITAIVQNPANLSASSKKLAKAEKSGKKTKSGKIERSGSSGDVGEETIEGGAKRWSADQMFAKNEQMLGRKLQYDGNAHNFGASHPRYVNYLERDGPVDSAVPTTVPGGASESSSSSSPSRAIDVNADISVFPHPFVFNMKKVNAAINSKLLSSEKLLSLIDGAGGASSVSTKSGKRR